MLNVLSVIFPILSEQLSGISLPCLLLLFKHKYGLLVCGVGPCCFGASHFTECLTAIWRLAAKAEPLQGELSAPAQPSSQGSVARAVSHLSYGWIRVQWSCKGVALKVCSFFFSFLFPLKGQIGESLQIFSKGSELMFRSIYLESPCFLLSFLRLKSNLMTQTSTHLVQGEGDVSQGRTLSPLLLSCSKTPELEWGNHPLCSSFLLSPQSNSVMQTTKSA